MRIALIHCSFIYTGGGERIALEHVRHLRQLGHDVVCYTPVIDKAACFPDIIDEFDVRTFLPQLPSWFPFHHAMIMVLTCLLSPFLFFRFLKTDIFVGENQPGAWIAFVLSFVLRKPYIVYLNQPNRVLYPRNVDVSFGWKSTVRDYHFLFHFLQFIRPLLSFLDRISVVKSSRLLVNGEYIGGVISSVYHKEFVDAPAATALQDESEIDLDAYRGSVRVKDETISKPYALITNRHDPQKRFDFVIEAMREVILQVPDVTLVIPGSFTQHTAVLRQLVKQFGLEKHVLFLGAISQKELQILYRNCCVYCYPSPEEDYGLGPLEAAAWAVPTVAWNHGGPTVTVENGVSGFLCEPYSVSEYAAHMISLFVSPDLRTHMGRAALERVKRLFNWEYHVSILDREIRALTIEDGVYDLASLGEGFSLQQLNFDMVGVGEVGDVKTEVFAHLQE